jgi:acyl-CoA reductase-like NAD-dependent aldehyde dehydrogenase
MPRGVAAVIGPFNFPIHLAHGAMVAHLLAGNPVIFKPSPLAAVVAQAYAVEMQAALPPGVFGLVQGGAAESIAVAEDPRVRAVCFTGSVAAGRNLAQRLAGDFSKELALELGGRNAAIVCADADLALAAAAIADGACLTCGQRCNATSRVIVEQAVAEKFEALLVAAIAAFQPGIPASADTRLGPLINAAAVERYVARISERADWLLPGGVCGEVGGRRGHYVLPALRRGTSDPVAEPFAPVVELEVCADLDASRPPSSRRANRASSGWPMRSWRGTFTRICPPPFRPARSRLAAGAGAAMAAPADAGSSASPPRSRRSSGARGSRLSDSATLF